MNKRFYILIVSIFICSYAFAQQNKLMFERLKNIAFTLKNNNQHNAYIDTLNKISYLYFKENRDSSLAYAAIASKLAFSTNYLKGQAMAKLNFSGNYYYSNDLVTALKLLNEAYAISTQISDDTLTALCLNNLGLFYLKQENYPKSIDHFNRGLALSIRIGDLNAQTLNQFNLGYCSAMLYEKHHRKIDFQNAVKYYLAAQKIAKRIKNTTYFYTCYNRLGDIYIANKNYLIGINYLTLILNNQKEISEWELGSTYTSLATAYLGMGNYDRCIYYGKLGLAKAKKVEDQIVVDKSLTLLAKVYKEKRDFKNAFAILEEKIAHSALYSNPTAKNRINQLLVDQKNLENRYLAQAIKAQEKNARLSKWTITLSISSFILVSILLAMAYRKTKQQERLNKLLAERNIDISQQQEVIKLQNIELKRHSDYQDKLMVVIGHDLRSPFATMLQATGLMKDNGLDNEEKQLVIKNFEEKIHHCLTILTNLISWANHNGLKQAERHVVNLENAVEHVITEIRPTALLKQLHIQHKKPTDTLHISADLNQLHVILRNIITNAVKFTPVRGRIIVWYEIHLMGKEIGLYIKDHGVGMDDEQVKKLFDFSGKSLSTIGTAGERGTGIGLDLIADFAKQNEIEIEVNSGVKKGTLFILKFQLG